MTRSTGLLAFGRLLRVSLAPSAAADVAAGVVLANGSWPADGRPLLLMGASLCVYHGGMALNDWADREADARGARERPIPTGAVSASTALVLATLLLALGPLLAFLVAPRAGGILLGVALLATLYDLVGRGAWRGPLLLALCRAGNLGAGLALFAPPLGADSPLLLAPLGYGLYVFLVSRLARLEDLGPGSARSHPAAWTVCASLTLFGLGGLAACLAARETGARPYQIASMALALFGTSGLLLTVWTLRGRPWSQREIQSTAGMCLRRLLVASAVLATGVGRPIGWAVGALILLGYPVSHALRRLFPPT